MSFTEDKRFVLNIMSFDRAIVSILTCYIIKLLLVMFDFDELKEFPLFDVSIFKEEKSVH